MRTFGSLAVLNVLGAAVSVVNTVLIAYFFGTGRAVEVYLAAIGLHASVSQPRADWPGGRGAASVVSRGT